MDPFQTAVTLIVKSLVLSARWEAEHRLHCLRRVASRSGPEAELQARILVLQDELERRDAIIALLRRRLRQVRSRRPYPLAERLRILWLMEYFRVPKRRVRDQLGVSRASIRRWLKAFEHRATSAHATAAPDRRTRRPRRWLSSSGASSRPTRCGGDIVSP